MGKWSRDEIDGYVCRALLIILEAVGSEDILYLKVSIVILGFSLVSCFNFCLNACVILIGCRFGCEEHDEWILCLFLYFFITYFQSQCSLSRSMV